MLRTDASIPESFLLEDREDMRVVEPLSPDCLVTPLPQPFRNLAIPHTTVMEFLDGIVKELLIVGIGCNEEVSSLQNHIETEEHINVIFR
mgnify:CR=1 FL=1